MTPARGPARAGRKPGKLSITSQVGRTPAPVRPSYGMCRRPATEGFL